MEEKTFYSHGKLMLCGEYAVLKGATAFALPTKAGQSLTVKTQATQSNEMVWKSYDYKNNLWFEATLSLPNLLVLESNEPSVAIQLVRFLTIAKVLNPTFLSSNVTYEVTTQLEFDREDGLGSSSTLTNNIAQWAQINPYDLHFNAFKGSGFDVAVAKEGLPLLYTMNGNTPIVKTLNWNKPFLDKLFFVHLNKKEISRSSIASANLNFTSTQIAQITRLSQLIAVNNDYFEFCLLLELAENEISSALGRASIKNELFPDFHGSIKSLGAWGGDYILATGDGLETYFNSKGYHKIIPYRDMIKE